jgi:hypothetical protein
MTEILGIGMEMGLEQTRRARRVLRDVGEKLANPTFENMQRCSMDLQYAVGCLEALEDALSRNFKSEAETKLLRAEMEETRGELRRVQTLLNGAKDFYHGWARLLSLTDEPAMHYTASGKASAPGSIDSGRVTVHG